MVAKVGMCLEPLLSRQLFFYLGRVWASFRTASTLHSALMVGASGFARLNLRLSQLSQK